jgi:hypothetical protein
MNLRPTVASPSGVPALLPALLAATAVGMVITWSRGAATEPRRAQGNASPVLAPHDRTTIAQPTRPNSAGRRFDLGAALLALAVLGDSAIEHYRGSFQNRAMYAPLAAASLTLLASAFGWSDRKQRWHPWRDRAYAVAAATGTAGLGFHAYNILKRPGGLSWINLFYAAPIGAPAALALAGFLGHSAEHVRETGRTATLFGMPTGRVLAGVSALGIAGTAAEAGLLHFRGAYHNPAMLLPVSVPPVASALLGATAVHPSRTLRRIAEPFLRLTAFLGVAGVGFHAFGVSRNMGGWRNWSQNVLNGPPMPAPPSFTALALSGLAALSLIERTADE